MSLTSLLLRLTRKAFLAPFIPLFGSVSPKVDQKTISFLCSLSGPGSCSYTARIQLPVHSGEFFSSVTNGLSSHGDLRFRRRKHLEKFPMFRPHTSSKCNSRQVKQADRHNQRSSLRFSRPWTMISGPHISIVT